MLLALLLTSFNLYASIEGACSHLSDDCHYYLCLAHEKSCGPKSYPVNFGLRYCLKYMNSLDQFSEEGKAWVNRVKLCLIREIEYYDTQMSCDELKIKAFKSHGPCYLSTGFCELSFKDQLQVAKVVGMAVATNALQEGMRVFWECSQRPSSNI